VEKKEAASSAMVFAVLEPPLGYHALQPVTAALQARQRRWQGSRE